MMQGISTWGTLAACCVICIWLLDTSHVCRASHVLHPCLPPGFGSYYRPQVCANAFDTMGNACDLLMLALLDSRCSALHHQSTANLQLQVLSNTAAKTCSFSAGPETAGMIAGLPSCFLAGQQHKTDAVDTQQHATRDKLLYAEAEMEQLPW